MCTVISEHLLETLGTLSTVIHLIKVPYCDILIKYLNAVVERLWFYVQNHYKKRT